MNKLSDAGQQVLAQQNFVSHTRIYIDGVLRIDTSVGLVNTPVISYQINRSRKLGAAKLSLNVANPGGIYSFKNDQPDPIFGYGNKIRLEEGIPVGQIIEWFPRFTGIIVSQVASNMGGKPSLSVYAMDNMKLLLDYLPDRIELLPEREPIKDEVLTVVPAGNYMHYKGNQENLPWADIPYPIFYKNGEKIKEDYEVDLISGDVYFGEKMWGPRKFEATQVTSTTYSIPETIQPGFSVKRSFQLSSAFDQRVFEDGIPKHITTTVNDKEITFSQPPFSDLSHSPLLQYTDKKIYVTTEVPYEVTADYWYYDDNSNLAKDVIGELALQAGFKPEQIMILDSENVSLKPMRFTNLTIKSAFEAIQKIKQQLAPNYIIYCDAEGNLRGDYTEKRDATGYDYKLELIKKIEAPVSEENLYSVVVAHGVDLNPNDLRNTATAENLLLADSIIKVGGTAASVLNKNTDDQISWHWIKKNKDTPPEYPIDLLTIDLVEAKKVEEISILVGNYKKGTIQQSISVQVTEDGTNWFYIDRSSRGVAGASSQWVTVKGGELEDRKIKGVKLIAEDAFNWTESHSYSSGGFLGIGSSVKTDNYYHWYLAIKEVQIWEENTIAVTSALCNCIGIGDGVTRSFFIPNTPIIPDIVKLYEDGVEIASDLALYTIDYAEGEVIFVTAPQGIITTNYTAKTKRQPLNSEEYVTFTGGEKLPLEKRKLLKKIGLKKNALKVDNYLNSYTDVKNRGELVLDEIRRLEDTLGIDVVYRPDIDICHFVGVKDPLLLNKDVETCYFVEEITESKQGYRPALNIKVSNYSEDEELSI